MSFKVIVEEDYVTVSGTSWSLDVEAWPENMDDLVQSWCSEHGLVLTPEDEEDPDSDEVEVPVGRPGYVPMSQNKPAPKTTGYKRIGN